jgi:putative membrane protein
MRTTILTVSVIWMFATCEQGPGPTRSAVEQETVLVTHSHDVATPRVRTVAFESEKHDERFIRNAASASRMQVELGRIALRQAQDSRVKQFARRMIDDNKTIERDLLDTAGARDISISPGMEPYHRTLLGQLSPLVGSNFDRAYVPMMESELHAMVREYDEEARNALDLDVRAFAERILPMQRDHLEKARSLADALRI